MRVMLTSPWIPAEWIRAHGLEPRGIWFEENAHVNTLPFSAGVCAFAEQVVQFAENQHDDAVIFTTTCDQLRRGFDTATLRGRCRAFLFNVPATQTPAAKQIYRAEVERLGRFLLEHGGSAPTPEFLQRELLWADETRRRLREAAPLAAARSFAETAAGFYDHGVFSAPSAAQSGNLVPLALVGGPLGRADWNVFGAVEAAGGRVALNATEFGERCLCPAFEDQEDPFEALINGYFDHIVDVFQRPNTRLYAWLKAGLSSRHVRGIVLWHFTGCDLWRAEAQTLREAFGLPVLPLEAGEAAGLSPREVTRLQAFLEALK
jgi:benzoyl-CoA reductase/2-hydroxyglutaryl-CoA dehydratase subunit BcrC/BadD/HgdB